MEFVRIANIGDFDRVRIKSFQLLGKYVGVVKNPDGSFYATEIACKHQNADLTTGRFQGDIVTCPRHGWTYNIRTGQCLNQPSAVLRRHALRVEGDNILVSLYPEDAGGPSAEDVDATPEIIFKPASDDRP